MVDRTQRRVYDLLRRIPTDGLPVAKQLFCTELNYHHANQPLSYRGWPDRARGSLSGPPTILARHESQFGDFDVIHATLSPEWRGRTFPLSVTAERLVINQLLKDHPYALFVFSDTEERHWHLVNVRYDEEAERRRVFRRIALGPQERVRTASERVAMLDLDALDRDLFGIAPLAIQQRHDEAFDVEAVTKKFFTDYRRIFEESEAQIEGLEGEDLRLFTQRLFNRLLFITFLERKGWLTFDGRDDYLRALWEAHQAEAGRDPEANFHRDRLKLLFFSGLNNVSNIDLMRINEGGFLAERIGRVPYLNGGLFEKEDLDRREGVRVADAVFGPIFDELIYHYNFTVTESTPLDIEVAVDPEMLGRIFEELVTGRHETGSYYTPKAVVSFMCREALKSYLCDTCPREDADIVAAFVDERDASQLRQPEEVLAALQRVRVCDHACGSGAYLVGMLHELVDLRQALFKARGVDPRAVYDKKMEIIQRNLYGVDIDPFAVNIARLRLWLSLTVDFEGETPPPLPNLEFKIEVGDSLTGPAPGQLQPDLFHHQQVQEYVRLKGQFLRAHGPEKADLRRRIEALQAEIASWASEGEGDGFDWAVTFAEVFTAQAPGTSEVPGTSGGFDIVLANPPYVRARLIKSAKPTLKKRYPEVYAGRADLYVYFYARALHLLREGGIGVFISSNKWLRSHYGNKLRQHLKSTSTIETVIDFGDLPVFGAIAYPQIISFRKTKPQQDSFLRALAVDDLSVVDHLSDVVRNQAWPQPQTSLRKSSWSLVKPRVLALLRTIRGAGKPLGEYVGDQFYRGIVTGLNKAFIIDRATRDKLIAEDPQSGEIIHPWLRGRNIDRWATDDVDSYIVFTYHGVNIEEYEAIKEYLHQFKERLEKRATSHLHCWYELQQPQTGIYECFAGDKIVWPDIADHCEFTLDTRGFYPDATVFMIPTDDKYLLGVLNSSVAEWFIQHTSPSIQQGYLRFKRVYLEPLSIPEPTDDQRKAIETLVRKLLDAEGQGPHVEGPVLSGVEGWERELNALVYQVYGLTEEDIAIVEGSLTE